jgi:hypothetical protein
MLWVIKIQFPVQQFGIRKQAMKHIFKKCKYVTWALLLGTETNLLIWKNMGKAGSSKQAGINSKKKTKKQKKKNQKNAENTKSGRYTAK